jgi:hypothetical protein
MDDDNYQNDHDSFYFSDGDSETCGDAFFDCIDAPEEDLEETLEDNESENKFVMFIKSIIVKIKSW